MKKILLHTEVNIFQNFKEHSLKVNFKQFLWKFRNMKWDPYMNLKERLSTAAFGKLTKISFEIKLFYKIDKLVNTSVREILSNVFLLGTYLLILRES